jgi:hypothetical protein
MIKNPVSPRYLRRRSAAAAKIVLIALLAVGCSRAPQRFNTMNHKLLGLSHGSLYASGIAFITPSTVTGQEEEKQAVAFTFADELSKVLPDLKIIHLSETLSAINAAGLADDYRSMYDNYKNTGIFDQKTLQRVGDATGTRYLGQLKLAAFHQGSMGRFSVFGLRLVETKYANIRLFFQIWDADTGGIVWEAVQELNWSEEAVAEKTITLQTVLAYTAEQMAADLP